MNGRLIAVLVITLVFIVAVGAAINKYKKKEVQLVSTYLVTYINGDTESLAINTPRSIGLTDDGCIVRNDTWARTVIRCGVRDFKLVTEFPIELNKPP